MGSVWVAPSSEPWPASMRPWSAMAIRPAHCGAASLVPPHWPQGADGRIVVGVVDREAGVGIGIVGHVGVGAVGRALRDHAFLVGRLALVGADAAAAAAPARFADVSGRDWIREFSVVPPTDTTLGEMAG